MFLIENVYVEGIILAGLDVYASSHPPHLKATSGTRGSVLSKRFMLGLGWRGEVVGGGWKVKLILMKVKLGPRPETNVLSPEVLYR